MPVEEAWRIHNEAQKGLSDGSRSRFAMSTEAGKLEVMSVTAAAPTMSETGAGALFGDSLVVFKIHRSPFEALSQGDVVIARSNPQALWLSDYEDRLIYDGRQPGAARFTALLEEADQAADEREVKAA